MSRPQSRQPIIAGVGQVANKDAERIVHPVDLLEEAALLAIKDAGIAAHRIGGVLATPLSVYSNDDASMMVADRLGLPPGVRYVSGYSGADPQRLLAQACQAIQAGTTDAMLVVGGIADASVRRANERGIEPPAPPTARWSQGSEGVPRLERVMGMKGMAGRHVAEIAAGAGLPSAYFALVESTFAAGRSAADHRAELGRLLSPFTSVAATHPDLAWFPNARTAAEISTPTSENRLVAEPFTKLMCSFPTVDLAAAVVVTADDARTGAVVRPIGLVSAREAGPPSGWRVPRPARLAAAGS